MITYWIIAGCAMGAVVARILKASERRKAYHAMGAGQKVWLNTLARAHRGY